jgi:hypothetical protein
MEAYTRKCVVGEVVRARVDLDAKTLVIHIHPSYSSPHISHALSSVIVSYSGGYANLC